MTKRLPAKHRPVQLLLEVLESRQLLAAKIDAYFEPLRLPDPGEQKIHTALPLGEVNAGGLGGTKPSKKDYDYTVLGNSADAVVSPLSSGLALMGGGTDVDAVFQWLGAKANGGDFVVIRATGTADYNRYIKDLAPSLDSVATIVIASAAGANDPFVAQKIREAEAIFIAGGDQSDYINLWTNTPVETAIYQAIQRGAPLGGTSAGLAVLGQYDFSATNGSITSPEALANPYDSRVTIDSGFVNEPDYASSPGGASVLRYLDNLITDSHFQQRDRLGRLVTFVARIDQDGPATASNPWGVGINEQTALLIEPDGQSRVVGNAYTSTKKTPLADQQRAVYLLTATANTVRNIAPGQPLTYTNLAVVKADFNPLTGTGDTFDFNTWVGAGTTAYELSALDVDLDGDTDLTSTQPGGLLY